MTYYKTMPNLWVYHSKYQTQVSVCYSQCLLWNQLFLKYLWLKRLWLKSYARFKTLEVTDIFDSQ